MSILKFDPATGWECEPITAAAYRIKDGKIAWLFNPYTGNRRDPRDVGSDVYGHLIEPGTENAEQACASGDDCCGKCHAEPASDLPPVHAAITKDGEPTPEQFRAAINDLVTRLQTADLVIQTLLFKAGGKVTVTAAECEQIPPGGAVATDVAEDRSSFTFRLVKVEPAPSAVQ